MADNESIAKAGSEFLNLLVSRLGDQTLVGAMEELMSRHSPKEMPNANLSGIQSPLALYRGTNLAGADLSDSVFQAADFTDANLTDANLTRVSLPKANCTKSHLLRANMTEAHLVEAIFDSAFLRQANLSRADLRKASFRKANLVGAKLHDANLEGTDLTGADLRLAKLNNANLRGAKLYEARLGKADLTGADLSELDLSRLDLSGSQLKGANLSKAILVETNLSRADLTGCLIYGIAAWNTIVSGSTQAELIISGPGEPTITVDHLEIAQFVYLLNNAAMRDVIDTIAKKAVLILGRFTERKPVLDALRAEIRRLGYLPMVFDFERPTQRDFTETIMTLAGMSVFVIADITSPRSTPLELQATVPNYRIPFVPIIQRGEEPFSMFVDLQGKYDWVMDTLEYDTVDNLIRGLEKAVILPAAARHEELSLKKGTKRAARSIEDYV